MNNILNNRSYNSDESRVSVIIPAYNVGHVIRVCLDSVLNQTLKPYEVFVINDGSTDDTESVAKSYGNKIILINQDNKGQGAARNAGLKRASGSFIAFIDADDYWLPDFLSKTIEFLNVYTQAIAVYTAWFRVLENGSKEIVPPMMKNSDSDNLKPVVIENFFEFWAKEAAIATGSILIRIEAIKAVGLQREDLRISQDLEHWALIATLGPWGFLPIPLFVCDSRRASKKNWWKKYITRRRLCPTVESWQVRVKQKLKQNQIDSFKIIRGYVASSYTQNMILGGRPIDALLTLRKYGDSFPNNRMTRMMKFGAKHGKIGWRIVCWITLGKELTKCFR